MFPSEMLGRAIHADRIREIERAARDRRLLAAVSEARLERAPDVRAATVTSAKRAACGDSAGQPA